MEKFFDRLLDVLKRDKRFFADDGTFLRNAVYQAAMNADEKLLKLLLNEDFMREKFFSDVAGVKVFDKIEFTWTINNRQFLPDSYTRFANKIELVDEHDNFISATNKTVLVFPYKDCVLEGGQTKDDQKRNEIFYNETLAHDEIDQLLYPKVFVNAVRYSNDAAQIAENFSDDDNLIIKGNNLLALASLTKKFAAKVKCIYIDQPYNTGNDSFGYNDRFNHSTWLVFMKNRLELAKKLLRNDGSIWISIDDDEQAYLKVLADEIFGRDNFVCNIVWQKKYGASNDAKWISDTHDFILVYAKDKNIWRPNLLPRTDEQLDDYKNPDNDPRGLWRASDLSARTYSASCDYEIIGPTGKIFKPPPTRSWTISKESFQVLDADNKIWWGKNRDARPMRKKFLSEVKQGIVPESWWSRDFADDNKIAKYEQKILFGDSSFMTAKPERLLERILTLATNAGDLVLDYHMGSGTTAAVAHKMGRRYIGVEQMDYIETLTVERLKKVIGGEQGGISAKVGWKGGGSFVYCELAKLNQNFVEAIEAANDFDTLKEIYERMIATGFISYKVDPAQIEPAGFAELSIENQKRFLLELLDKNLLYVNLCDIDDEEFAIADADKNFTRSFYFKADTAANTIAPKPTTAAITIF